MTGFNYAGCPGASKVFHQGAGHLLTYALLYLQPPGINLQEPWQLAYPYDIPFRAGDVGDMSDPGEWQHMMLACRVKFDIFAQYHLIMPIPVEFLYDIGGFHSISCEQFLPRSDHSIWGFFHSIPRGIIPDLFDNRGHRR
jgi:hypothetical protein